MIYAYRCEFCELSFDRVCRLSDYENTPEFDCPSCGQVARQVITPPRLFTKGFEPFRSPVDGSIISTHRELAEHNKRNNVVNLHDGYDEKAVQSFTKQDLFKGHEEERKKDLADDMKKAVTKLENGYNPTPAPYTEEFPDA